jgi:hypothetical protein
MCYWLTTPMLLTPLEVTGPAKHPTHGQFRRVKRLRIRYGTLGVNFAKPALREELHAHHDHSQRE